MAPAPSHPSPQLQDDLRRLAGDLKGGHRDETWRISLEDVPAWRSQGFAGLLLHRFSDQLPVLEPAVVDALEHSLGRAAEQAVSLESRAVAAKRLLADHGIPCRILKGTAVGHLDYLDPCLRPAGDVDLLVPGSDIRQAVRLLLDQGLQRRYPEPYPGYDERLGKGVTLTCSNRIEIDLHRTLALGYFGTALPIEDLWGPGDAFEVAGHELVGLPRPERFVHAALHLVLSPLPKVIQAWDLLEIESSLGGGGAAQVIEVADRWRCADLVARAVVRTTGWLGDVWVDNQLLSWAAARKPSPTERMWYSTYHGGWASSSLRTAAAVAGMRPRRAAGAAAVSLLRRRVRDRR